MVPPDSQRIPRARCYSGTPPRPPAVLSRTGVSPTTPTLSRGLPLTPQTSLGSTAALPRQRPTTPRPQRLPASTRPRFSLLRFRSPLLTESRLFSLPVGTEMFHFPTFPPHALCVQARVTPHDWCGVPPFGHPRINARLAAPRGLSQPPTSFIGSWCPGIHRAPLPTWPHNNPPHMPHRTQPAGHPGAGHKPGTQIDHAINQSQKMLASTVQFSTSHPRHHPESAPRGPHQRWAVRNPGGPEEEETDNTSSRSLRTQQRAYHPRTPAAPLHAPAGGAVLGAGDRRRRPNWSAFHPRAPPQKPAARSRMSGPSRPGRGCHWAPSSTCWRPAAP